MIQIEKPIKPEIVWNHIDGPLLYLSDGGIHWLTLYERFLLHFRFTNIEKLNKEYTGNKK